MASGTTLLRMPGGSWSNDYDWLGCELGDPQRCDWTWAMRPSDFLGLARGHRICPAMWTVSINGTAQEAAAVVAFFNGDVDDDRPIGTDRNGRDWLTVGHWAQLRAEHGHPDAACRSATGRSATRCTARSSRPGPTARRGAGRTSGPATAPSTSTGTADHDGFLAVPRRDAGRRSRHRGRRGRCRRPRRVERLGRQGDEGAPATSIDFYIVHHYGSNGDVSADDVFGIPRRAVAEHHRVTSGKAIADHGIDGDVPIAVTEHNLVAIHRRRQRTADDDRRVNAFYLAETIGQMAANGVDDRQPVEPRQRSRPRTAPTTA